MPFLDRTEAHFNRHFEWVKTKYGNNHELSKILNQDIDWIRFVAELRNAMEHPGEGQILEIRNITLMPGNKFTAPTWAYDLRKKLNKKSGYTDLIWDQDVMLNNLFYFFEDMMLLTIKEKLKDNKLLLLYKIEDNDIRERMSYPVFHHNKSGRLENGRRRCIGKSAM